jgi:predicted nucleic acid-binding protein
LTVFVLDARPALGTGPTVYDALYLVLAIQTGHTLLTADERLMNAADKRFPICWLGALA